MTARTTLETAGWTRPDGSTWILHFAWARNPLPMNGPRGHWARHAAASRSVRATSAAAARFVGRIPPLGRCRVQLTWWVATRRTRDADNLAALEKPIFDGLVDAGVVADDRPELMDKPRAVIRHVDDARGLVSAPCFTLTVQRIDDEEAA